ncbi:TetR/AcrR family transcriptional regulator [Paroceanicella profunda]|uniref:TetR/AcrR family transcriptional regulator n=1 Tax=Paroceanicella profunda TaxID=2579971 RepID=UPI001EEFEA43|nr:TetR/AcrR family transcriptional regulator [Paroceanicella profunda]
MAESSDRPARRGRPRSVATEQAILLSAYDIMAEEGLAAATIDAVARRSKVSKMTIYKWWPSREALLIDAFLMRAAALLPLGAGGAPLDVVEDHAAAYAEALAGDFGKVQLAVVAECITNGGSAAIFSERYLGPRRAALLEVLRAGQAGGSITRAQEAGDLYDQIYGTLFYQYVFGFRAPARDHARALVRAVLTRP